MQLKTVPDYDNNHPRYFVLVQDGMYGPWKLRDELGIITFPTLARVFLTLGGMIEWDRWSEESQAWIQFMNKGKSI
jgi:hypothetical protein